MRYVLVEGFTPIATSLTMSDLRCEARNKYRCRMDRWIEIDGEWFNGPYSIHQVPSVFSNETRDLIKQLAELRVKHDDLTKKLSAIAEFAQKTIDTLRSEGCVE